MNTTIHLLWLLFAATWPATPGEQWRLVYEDGAVEATSAAPLVPAGKKVVFAWAWSDTAAPRRMEMAQVGKQRLTADATRLRIRIAGWNARTMTGSRLVAAPLPMWAEVPEDSLPSWPVPAAGQLDIPVDPRTEWRLRLSGHGWGTWWIDLAPGQISATLAPVAAPDLKLEITDTAGGLLAGSWMRLLEGAQGRRGGTRPWAIYGPGQGGLAVSNLPDAEEVIGIFGAAEHAPFVFRGRIADLPPQVRLGTGATVSGRFIDDARKPVQGARVYIESWLAADVSGLTSRSMETAPDGSWSLTGLPPGEAALWAQARGFAPYRLRLTLPEGKTDLGTASLQRGRAVRILAVDDQGSPVPGAVVEAGLGLSARTDTHGIAVLSQVDPKGSLELSIRAARHLPRESRIDPPFPALSRIVIDRAFTIEGHFLDPHGIPVSEGLAVLRRGILSTSAPLRSDGRFELDLRAGEAADLALSSPSTRELRLPIASGLAGEVRDLGALRAPPGSDIVGRITSARTGQPVAGARVWLPRAAEGGALLAWLDRNLIEARSGADGRFRLTGAMEGPGQLRVDAAGFARSQLPVQPLEEGTATDVGEIALVEGATLRVLVQDADREAIARADLRGDWLELDMLTAPVQDGVAVLRNVPPGQARVTVLQGSKLLCESEVIVPVAMEETEVECSGGALRVRGTVQVGGRRAGPGTLIWLPPAPELPARIANVSSPGGLRQQQVFGQGRPQVEVEVAADGSFFTDELTAGAWQVSWVPPSGSLSQAQAIDLPHLPKGSEYAALLSFPGSSIFGAVLDTDERPAEGARVRDLRSGALAFAGSDGAFELTSVTPGKHWLQAERDELASPVEEVEVGPDRAGEPVRLVLGEPHDPELQVQVLGPEGTPVPGAFVFLEEQGRGQRILTTGPDGKAAARIDRPAPAGVRLAAMANGVWILGSWRRWGEIEEIVSLRVGPWGSLRVESTARTGALRILSPQGWDIAWLLTRLGSRPALTPGHPLEIQGLPEGVYTVSFEGATATATVREGEQAELEVN